MRVARKQRAATGFPHPMSSPADALQGGSDGRRRLDQHHLVEVADIDAHFQRRGGDDGLELALLQPRLHLRADFPRQRAVMRPRHGSGGFLVQLQRDLLRHPAAVGEEEGGTVGVDDVAEALRQRRPDGVAVVCRHARLFGEAHAEGDVLGRIGLDHPDRPTATVLVATADVIRHGVERTHGGGKGDALELAGHLHQPFEASHKRGTAPVVGDGMDLVENHALDGSERMPPTHGGQEQHQALRRGDEQLRRPTQHALPFALLRVATARLHPQAGERVTVRREAVLQLGDGRKQVAPNVVVQRLQG